LDRNSAAKNTGSSLGKRSSGKEVSNKHFYLIYGIIVVLIVVITLIILQNPEDPIVMVRRFAGTFAYLTIFLAIVSSEYIVKMRKISGLSFLNAHHNLARIGILLMLIHPITFILQGRGINIFSPVSFPVNPYIGYAGRPAFYLFLLAVGIALYRKKYRGWLKVHYLNYLAFLLITVHALMLGDDFELNIMRMLALVMAVIVTAIFIHKRLIRRQKKKLKQ
jgi:DMSO/TMAO reductase YedYZ heme-binding membrane subunit